MVVRTLLVIHGQLDSIRDTNSNVEQQRRIDLVMAGREEENTHEIALSGDVNELVEEIDGLEIVDDDDENSEDDSDGDV